MKIRTSILLSLISVLFSSTLVFAQQKAIVSKAKYFDKTPPLKEMPQISPLNRSEDWEEGEILNEDDERVRNDNPRPLPIGRDPLLQDKFGNMRSRDINRNFEGTSNRNSVYPPDTDGDVSQDYYFQMINLSFQIFDKEGNSLYGPVDNSTLWQGFIGSWSGTNDGDPIVLYDEQAGRWVASQFAINTPDSTFWELIAVSESSDPLGSWYRYAFQFPVFNDYPKMGIWPDGYYFSFNMFGDYRRVAACALEREAMIAGDSTARMILFDLPQGAGPWSMLPSDFDGPAPAPGTPNYFMYAMDDAFGSADQLSIWEFTADWQNPENSTFQQSQDLPVAPFDSEICPAYRGRCITQPDNAPLLESLSDRLMYRLQYRNFGTYQTMVTNHTVDVDGNGHAGIRWYELRNMDDGNGWIVYQQGTYAPDQDNRWMGSIAMDGRGYIALGFSVSGENTYPSIHITGRSPDSPLGEMTFYEDEVMRGGGSQGGDACRWGDYSMMSVDPSDDSTFWFTTEYYAESSAVGWQTRIASFTLVEDHIPPAAVSDLQANSTTTNAISLHWTTSGNDGNEGTAFLYDMRYSTDPITEENFDSAIHIENSPEPLEAGNIQYFTLGGLEYDTHYYFALKVRDKQFNFSGISNISDAVTPAPPLFTLPEDSLTAKLFPGSIADYTFPLLNQGGSDIYLNIVKDTSLQEQRSRNYGNYADLSRKADPATEEAFQKNLELMQESGDRSAGDVLASYPGAPAITAGIVWVNGNLYMIDMQNSLLMLYDTATSQISDTMIIHAQAFGICWDGNYLWIGNDVGNVFAYNLDGSPAGYSFSLPYGGYSSLTWDGEYFLANFIMQNNPDVYRLDESGNIKKIYHTNLNKRMIWQAVWVPEHYKGNYWFTNNSGKITQMKTEGDQLLKVAEYNAPASSSYSLTHDQNDLWYAKFGGTIYRIDDGVDELNWVKIQTSKDTIPAASQKDIGLQFNTGELTYGQYSAYMIISSNDPERPLINVPVKLDVTSIDLGPDTSFCNHLNMLLDAGPGFAQYLWPDGSNGQTFLADSSGFGSGPAVFWVDVTDNGGVSVRDSINIFLNDCSGIHEFTDGMKVRLFPNPNQGVFDIVTENQTDDLEIEIYDIYGQRVFHRIVSGGGSGSGRTHLDLSAFSKGIYPVKLISGKVLRQDKLLIR